MAETHPDERAVRDGEPLPSETTQVGDHPTPQTNEDAAAAPRAHDAAAYVRDARARSADKMVVVLALAVLLAPLVYGLFPGDAYARVALLVVALVTAGGLSLWVVPKWQVASLKDLSDEARFGLENEARRTLAQILAGLFLFAGVYGTVRNIQVSEGGQLSERYSKGIERLAGEKVHVRVGGVFTLITLANESPQYRRDIISFFSDFVRDYAAYRPQPRSEPTPADATLSPATPASPPDVCRDNDHKDAEDHAREIELIIEFLGNPANIQRELKFGKTYLKGLKWSNLVFIEPDFSDACLEDARFQSSNLSHARFDNANLRRVDFAGANLSYATFDGADLDGAILKGADLTGANFLKAKGLTLQQVMVAKGLKEERAQGGENRPAATFNPELSKEIEAELRKIEADRIKERSLLPR